MNTTQYIHFILLFLFVLVLSGCEDSIEDLPNSNTVNLNNNQANILGYAPVNFEVLNLTSNNSKFAIVPENVEDISGIGLRTCKDGLHEFIVSKIELEYYTSEYTSSEIQFWLKTTSNTAGSFIISSNKNCLDTLLSDNQEKSIAISDKPSGYYSKEIWIKNTNTQLDGAELSFYVTNTLGDTLSLDKVKFYPVVLKQIALKGKNTIGLQYPDGSGAGHNWLTIQFPEIGLDSSFGFWPSSTSSLSSRGIVRFASGPFDNPPDVHYSDYSHTFYLKTENIDKIINYINTVRNHLPYWNAPILSDAYDCSTFATEALREAGVNIPVMDWPNDVGNWLTYFEKQN
jgi:hypothetical protein